MPEIKSLEDTHYFDEEEPISDFSESVDALAPTVDEIARSVGLCAFLRCTMLTLWHIQSSETV